MTHALHSIPFHSTLHCTTLHHIAIALPFIAVMSTSTLDDFCIEERLGSGSFGVVYRVKRKVDNATYVLKQIHLSSLRASDQSSALTECRLLASVDAKHVVRYYDCFIDSTDNTLNLVMEYCKRGDLQHKLKAQRGCLLTEDSIWRYFIQAAVGLAELHARKILHRDVKSANLFLTADDEVRVGDLGVAKILDSGTMHARTTVGTPFYLSPELCEGRPYDARTDCWALGVVLYELCTLKHPFNAANQGELILKIMKGKYPPLPAIYAATALPTVLSACLRRDPARRPNVMQILASASVEAKARALGIELPQQVQALIEKRKAAMTLGTNLPPKRPGTVGERKTRPHVNAEGHAPAAASRSAAHPLVSPPDSLHRPTIPPPNRSRSAGVGPRKARDGRVRARMGASAVASSLPSPGVVCGVAPARPLPPGQQRALDAAALAAGKAPGRRGRGRGGKARGGAERNKTAAAQMVRDLPDIINPHWQPASFVPSPDPLVASDPSSSHVSPRLRSPTVDSKKPSVSALKQALASAPPRSLHSSTPISTASSTSASFRQSETSSADSTLVHTSSSTSSDSQHSQHPSARHHTHDSLRNNNNEEEEEEEEEPEDEELGEGEQSDENDDATADTVGDDGSNYDDANPLELRVPDDDAFDTNPSLDIDVDDDDTVGWSTDDDMTVQWRILDDNGQEAGNSSKSEQQLYDEDDHEEEGERSSSGSTLRQAQASSPVPHVASLPSSSSSCRPPNRPAVVSSISSRLGHLRSQLAAIRGEVISAVGEVNLQLLLDYYHTLTNRTNDDEQENENMNKSDASTRVDDVDRSDSDNMQPEWLQTLLRDQSRVDIVTRIYQLLYLQEEEARCNHILEMATAAAQSTKNNASTADADSDSRSSTRHVNLTPRLTPAVSSSDALNHTNNLTIKRQSVLHRPQRVSTAEPGSRARNSVLPADSRRSTSTNTGTRTTQQTTASRLSATVSLKEANSNAKPKASATAKPTPATHQAKTKSKTIHPVKAGRQGNKGNDPSSSPSIGYAAPPIDLTRYGIEPNPGPASPNGAHSATDNHSSPSQPQQQQQQQQAQSSAVQQLPPVAQDTPPPQHMYTSLSSSPSSPLNEGQGSPHRDPPPSYEIAMTTMDARSSTHHAHAISCGVDERVRTPTGTPAAVSHIHDASPAHAHGHPPPSTSTYVATYPSTLTTAPVMPSPSSMPPPASSSPASPSTVVLNGVIHQGSFDPFRLPPPGHHYFPDA